MAPELPEMFKQNPLFNFIKQSKQGDKNSTLHGSNLREHKLFPSSNRKSLGNMYQDV